MTPFNLCILMLILTVLFISRRQSLRRRHLQHRTPHPFTRRKLLTQAQTQSNRTSKNRKPGWVHTEVLRLLAMTRGHAGCRTVAAMFNACFAFRGESVSKTYVAELRKKSRYAIAQLRKVMRQPPRPGKPNQTWALGLDARDDW